MTAVLMQGYDKGPTCTATAHKPCVTSSTMLFVQQLGQYTIQLRSTHTKKSESITTAMPSDHAV